MRCSAAGVEYVLSNGACLCKGVASWRAVFRYHNQSWHQYTGCIYFLWCISRSGTVAVVNVPSDASTFVYWGSGWQWHEDHTYIFHIIYMIVECALHRTQSSRAHFPPEITCSTVSNELIAYNDENKPGYQCKECNIVPLAVHLNWHFKSFTHSTNSNNNGVTTSVIQLISRLKLSSIATLISPLNYNKYTVIIASILMILII